MQERSAGKDTTTGHWEIAGVILDQPFATFERFPDELVRAIEREADVHFIGNCARSGTTILEELGAEHVRTGHPILYTSADSVLQIAAHEEVVPLERLYEICHIARRHADHFRIGRVIARPFLGEPRKFPTHRAPSRFLDASRRARFWMRCGEHGLAVIGIGKISDIFAGQGITRVVSDRFEPEGMARIDELWRENRNGLLFANLVDFDMLFGHRRDVAGYAQRLGGVRSLVRRLSSRRFRRMISSSSPPTTATIRRSAAPIIRAKKSRFSSCTTAIRAISERGRPLPMWPRLLERLFLTSAAVAGRNLVLGNDRMLNSKKCTFPASSKKSVTVMN